jgi:ribonuclease HII
MPLKAYHTKNQLEAGCDEAGRGCLAGPVFAAAVVFPADFSNEEINDSKALAASKREELRILIEKNALAWAVAEVSPEEIDEINILNASFSAMNKAVLQLKIQPDFLLIDGNRFKNQTAIPHLCVVKGDAAYLSIAAASILAKTYRDEYMERLSTAFPHYGWEKNKGYPTGEHRKAIERYGITVHHRKSFNLLPLQLDLKF